jgi:hypothetical protein
VFVWKTDAPPEGQLAGALIDRPQPGPYYRGPDCEDDYPKTCKWSGKSYAALKATIEREVPPGRLRAHALQRIKTLEKPPYEVDQASATEWAKRADTSAHLAAAYPEALAKSLIETGCAADGAPYVIGGLIRQLDFRFKKQPLQEIEVAKAFLSAATCPGARGLSDANKAALQKIVGRAAKPTEAGAAGD